jgi:putative phosphoesterase
MALAGSLADRVLEARVDALGDVIVGAVELLGEFGTMLFESDGKSNISRVAAIYDIHGNLPALEAVLADVRRARVDLIVVGGDVLPGPMPRETLACLLDAEMPVRFIRGNGDRESVALSAGALTSDVPERFQPAVRWSGQQLSAAEASIVAHWPPTVELDIQGLGRVLFCHATPRSDKEIFTRVTPEASLVPVFTDVNAAVVVCGHTHMQFDRMVGATRVVNAGSVGMPFGAPGAYWLLLGSEIELRRTVYDFEQAASRIRATQYPSAEEFAARSVSSPPSEEEMLAVYGGAKPFTPSAPVTTASSVTR